MGQWIAAQTIKTLKQKKDLPWFRDDFPNPPSH
jgi:hypothetical protein